VVLLNSLTEFRAGTAAVKQTLAGGLGGKPHKTICFDRRHELVLHSITFSGKRTLRRHTASKANSQERFCGPPSQTKLVLTVAIAQYCTGLYFPRERPQASKH
jgi:hypothetical protein